jgi:hypothetical protein
LIRCLQHWHLVSLVKLTFNPYSWKWFGQQLITCQQLTQILAWLGVCNIGLKAKSHWNFLWLAVSKYWLGIDTVLVVQGLYCFSSQGLILAFLLVVNNWSVIISSIPQLSVIMNWSVVSSSIPLLSVSMNWSVVSSTVSISTSVIYFEFELICL